MFKLEFIYNNVIMVFNKQLKGFKMLLQNITTYAFIIALLIVAYLVS